MMNDPHSSEKMQQLAKLAKELIGGDSGAMDLLIIEAPRGMADTPEKAMDFAKDLSGEEHSSECLMEEMGEEAPEAPDQDAESSGLGSNEWPLHDKVSELIIQWEPDTPEGQQYLADLKDALDKNEHGYLDTVRGRKVAAELSDDPEEANVQAQQYFEDLPEQPGRVIGGPEASRYSPRFSTAQASDPKGGQTVEEAAASHAEKADTAEGRFWNLVNQADEEISGVHREAGGENYSTPFTFNLSAVYEFLDPKYKKMMDRIDASRPEMERTRSAREEFEEEFPPTKKPSK